MNALKDFKLKRIKKYAENYNLDLLIGSLPENIYYMTSFRSISHNILHKVQVYSLFNCKDEKLTLVIPRADVPTVLEQVGDIGISCYGNFYFEISTEHQSTFNHLYQILESTYPAPENALIETISAAGMQKGRIGLDESRVPIQLWKRLESTFPSIEFVPAANILAEIRMIKHEDEILLLERSAEIAEESLFAALSKFEKGMSEDDLGWLYRKEVVQRGAEPYFNVITEGNRSAYADTVNTSQKITDGSVIRFDLGCVYKGYNSDIARTAVVGSSSSKVENYYKYILEGEELAIEAVRPGVTAEEIFTVAMDKTMEGIPHYRRHHCGHGIGLEIYDLPSIAKGVDTILEPGMVLCLETPYYELGWAGVQIEDTIVVTENGYRYLSKSSRELIKIGG